MQASCSLYPLTGGNADRWCLAEDVWHDLVVKYWGRMIGEFAGILLPLLWIPENGGHVGIMGMCILFPSTPGFWCKLAQLREVI